MLNQNLQLILVVYWITNLAMGVTLSGNGTSGGFTVQENSSLQLTCSTSTDVNYVSYNVRLLSLTKIITAVGFGPLGCATDPAPPSYLSCSCVSRREYVCVIRTVTRNMNGDVWFCLPPAGDSNDNSGDKTIVVTIGITAVSMDFPAVRSLSVIDNTARQFRCATSVGNPQAIVEWYKDNGTPNRADDTEITTGKETYPIPSGSLIVTIGKLTLTVQRNDHEVGVYCRANNGGDWVYSVSVFLDVQYDPSTPKVSYKNADVTSQVRVISGRPLTLTCSSTGNPPPTYIWTYPDGDSHSGPTLQLASVLQTHTGGVTCTAMNTLSPTGGTAVDKTRAKTITLQVLYPPHTPLCTISGTSISTTVVLVEGTDSTITCTSSANPPLITYIWSTPRRGLLSGASLSLINVQHLADQGQYTLTITNTMDPTGGKLETGTNSTMFSVDVQYEPSSPKVSYKGFEVSASIRVISGRSVKLNCSSTGNPQPTYTWWYPGGGSHEGQTLLLANIQAIHAGEVKCTARNKLSPTGGTLVDRTEQTATSINVLYPPRTPSCNISGTSISTPAILVEGTDSIISCTSYSNPPLITYTWSTPGRGQVRGARLSLNNVQHITDHGKYILTVTNDMDPTGANMEMGTSNTAFSVDVQYGPSNPNISYQGAVVKSYVRVLSGRSITLTCSSTGNPSPTYTWTYPHGRSHSGPNLTFSSVQTTHAGNVSCSTRNTLSPTIGTAVVKTRQTTASLQVLYPPSKPVCTLSETTISTTAVLLEGTDTTISCISTAFPTLITYTWSTPSRGLVSGASLSLTNVQHHADQGLYTLTVRNTMDPTKGNTKTGTNTTALSVDVQFGPKVQLPQTYDILEGSVLNYHCPFIPGNPSQTSLVWTSSVNNRQWNSQIVSISSVQKSDDGMYTCTATNQMTPTGYPVQTGSQGGNMHLNVQYESIVNDFYVTEYIGTFNVTQTENSNVTFTCTVDSNPLASINIRKDSEMKISIDHSRQLKYTIAKLTCWDTGLYTCDSRNAFNKKNLSKKYLNLCVTCTPRRAPGLDIKMNLTARQHENTTLQYTVFAFPVPSPSQFVWKKCTSSKKCSTLSNISGKTEITTIGLSSNLTIFDIAIDDYGVYSISIDNGIGEALVEMIYLKQAEISHVKPQTSTIAGGVTAGILTVLGILVVILVLRRKYSVTCAFKFTRKEGPRSRHIAHGAENPGYDVAATYEEVSMTSDKTVYEALSMANIRNDIGNEGSNKSHVYTTLDDSNSKPNAYYENVKEEDPVYKNTSLKTPVQTVL
ncbi:hemicentin-1-like isoform X2 [Mya arenaria]|uniref:hemicentin-1-like isoform X2 n=1 Tax=Mya arenaria TaxID=6604 RepID=UPI0022E7EE70|nr:hemicentin-1-like isoform X2 [Mya arenaria]